MAEEDNWGTVEIPDTKDEDKVEYEIEEKAVEQEVKKEAQPEIKEEEPKELEGIETAGAQKRIRQLVKQRKEKEEQLAAIMQQNEELTQRLQTRENEVKNISKHTLDLSEKQLTDKIALAREVYLEAFDEGEKEKLLNAQEMLNEAQNDLKQVTSAKANYERQAQQPVAQPMQQQQQIPQPAADPKAEEWAESNDWFGKDNVMTAAALAIDAELKNEGYNPSDNDFYKEIDNIIKNAFPQKFGEAQERVQESTSTPAQVVSGSSRSSPSSKNKVKLTQEDMRLAEKWNIRFKGYIPFLS